MRLHRFYVKQPLGEEIVVDDVSTIKQWTRVFRYKAGDLVILFDGHFKDCTYEITSVSAKEVALHLISLKEIPPQDKTLTIYVSVIKKDNFELVVQKCTELGVSRIVPILAEHSEKKNINIERLEIIAKEAAEQCGRGDVPIIEEVVTLSDAYLQRDRGVTHIIASMDGASNTTSLGKELLSNKYLRVTKL